MRARLRSWWQKIKQHRLTILVVAIILIVAIGLIIVGYRFDWTGFNGNSKSGKTLWDWMQLLFIPVVLAVAGFWFNHRERKAAELRAENERKAAELRSSAEREIEQQRAQTERDIAEDNQREASLQAYINEMSELLLEKQLRESQPDDEVRTIGRVRTLTVLRGLDPSRKSSVIQFLHEAGLIDKDKYIIILSGADLSGTKLRKANLSRADLHEANLSYATLIGANLREANLREANLREAYLWRADLREAKLSKANLREALLQGANLREADLHEADLREAYFNRDPTSWIAADLSEADLREAKLSGAILLSANLREAKLSRADLYKADLTVANLREALLQGANLREAKLSYADLSGANLEGALGVTVEELEKETKSLEGATMPDGTIHP